MRAWLLSGARGVAAAIALCLSAVGVCAFAEDVKVPGGTKGIAAALGIAPAPDRARLLSELARLIYAPPAGRYYDPEGMQERLARHLDAVDRFQVALAAAQSSDGLTLASASKKTERKRLTTVLDLIGLKVVEKKKNFSVAPSGKKEAIERVKLLAAVGIDLTDVARRLNAGEAVRIEIPMESVPVPLPAAVWSRLVFGRSVSSDRLIGAILGDRRAALLAAGLASLDDPTLEFIAQTPSVIERLYAERSGVFWAFARGLHVSDGRVRPPGGDAAVALWESVIDEKVTRPERFIEKLFGRANGRTAYLYDTIAHLDDPHASFALGLWIPDARDRAASFRALAAAVESAYPSWDIEPRPSARMPYDVTALLNVVKVTGEGMPAAPAWRVFWDRALSDLDLPDDPERQFKNIAREGSVDAAWLVEHFVLGLEGERADRIAALTFAQRAFGDVRPDGSAETVLAVRAFFRQPLLALTLDRMGIVDPAVYVAAARRGVTVNALNRNEAFLALGQYQSAVAFVARLRLTRVITADTATALVKSLAAVPVAGEGVRRGMLDWLTGTLAPAAHLSIDDLGGSLVQALAGVGSNAAGPAAVTVQWEDQTYRLDLAGAELQRISEAQASLGAPTLTEVVAFSTALDRIQAGPATLSELKNAAEGLKAASALFRNDATVPSGLDAFEDPRALVTKTLGKLLQLTKAKDLPKAPKLVEPLRELAGQLLTDSMMGLVYAVALGPTERGSALGGNVARRHDFGFLERGPDETRRRAAWQLPLVDPVAGMPWHVKGSLLGLDVGLASLRLRRLTDAPVEAAALSGNERSTLTRGLALLNPFDFTDTDRAQIVAALSRGRERVRSLTTHPDALDAVVKDTGLDGRRRRELLWVLKEEPGHVLEYFSMGELLAAGGPAKEVGQTWGSPDTALRGCLCTVIELPRWNTYTGRISAGLLAGRLVDLNLRLAELTADAGLPAAVVPALLSASMQDFIDRARASDEDDWLTLVRTAQAVTRERLADYAAALTAAGGPLVPAGVPIVKQGPR